LCQTIVEHQVHKEPEVNRTIPSGIWYSYAQAITEIFPYECLATWYHRDHNGDVTGKLFNRLGNYRYSLAKKGITPPRQISADEARLMDLKVRVFYYNNSNFD